MVYVDVILPLGISGTYFYRVPDSITCPSEGMRVLVPVGNRPYVGIVYHSAVDLPSSLDPLKVKSLIAVLDSAPAVNKQQMALWEWLATY